MPAVLKLYVKTWCPWCVTAKRDLDHRGFFYEEIDVERDSVGYREMIRLSGQSRTPTLVAGSHVLPDFGTEELELFLKKHSIEP